MERQFTLILPEKVQSISLTNSIGQTTQHWTEDAFPEYWQMPTLNLSAGIYYITVETSLDKSTKPIVVID
ncbi:MAG: hypothetical protein AB8F74_06510 [Saprospiraceae bacterium]